MGAVLALTALLVATFVALAMLLAAQANTASVVNRAGRQRMLCERMIAARLAEQLAPTTGEQVAARVQVVDACAQWRRSQAWLEQVEGLAGVGRHSSVAVASALVRLRRAGEALGVAVHAQHLGPAAVVALQAQAGAYLVDLDALVDQYAGEARGRVCRLVLITVVLGALILGSLGMLTVRVLRPAFHRLHDAITLRTHLQAQELRTQELTVASAVARSIGEDLHDGVGQALTALSLSATTLGRSLAAHPAQGHALAMANAARAALVQVRAAASRLSPPALERTGLPAALSRLAEDVRLETGIDCQVTCSTDPPHGTEDLYRIAQEAIANAVRHGQARHIAIRLGTDGRWGELEITDDGVGGSSAAQGLGLRSMQHRARRLGGVLDAGPRPAGGWRVHCTFSLESPGTPCS